MTLRPYVLVVLLDVACSSPRAAAPPSCVKPGQYTLALTGVGSTQCPMSFNTASAVFVVGPDGGPDTLSIPGAPAVTCARVDNFSTTCSVLASRCTSGGTNPDTIVLVQLFNGATAGGAVDEVIVQRLSGTSCTDEYTLTRTQQP